MNKIFGNLLMLSRRFLGVRGVSVLRDTIGDLAIIFHVVEPANSFCKENCISALMRVKDEEWWIEPSILSIKELVHEYVIIDQSTYDRTPEIIDNLKENYALNILHIRDFNPDYLEISNKALKMTKCKWILRWDGDYIAREELTPTINSLIESLDPRKYYNIYWPHINFEVDLFHINTKNTLHIEHWLVTRSRGIKFIPVQYFEFLYTPPYHKRIDLSKPLSLHLRTVKPPLRLLEWKYWWEMRKKKLLGKISLYDYMRSRIKNDFGTEDLNEAALKLVKQLRERDDIGKYDVSVWGDYPKILRDYARQKFGIEL